MGVMFCFSAVFEELVVLSIFFLIDVKEGACMVILDFVRYNIKDVLDGVYRIEGICLVLLLKDICGQHLVGIRIEGGSIGAKV